MDELFHRTRGAECGSDLEFDSLVGDELSNEDAARLQAHIVACSRCASRVQLIREHAASFVERPIGALRERPATSVHVEKRYETRSWLRVGFPLAAAALLVWLLRGEDAAPLEPSMTDLPTTAAQPDEVQHPVRPPATEQAVPSEAVETTARRPTPAVRPPRSTDGVATRGTRTKGQASLEFFVERDGRARRGTSEDVLYPGDRIRFSYTSDREQSLVIFSIDGAGVVSRYHPASGGAASIRGGTDVLLGSSVVLDDVVGQERVYGLFCTGDVDLEDLQRRLERDGVDVSWPAHCTVDELVLDKQLPPTVEPDATRP